MTIYDVHAHCIPEGLVETLRADPDRYGIAVREDDGQVRASVAGKDLSIPVRRDLGDLPARLAAMDRAGVDVQLLSSWIDLSAYDLEASTGVRYARMFNEALAATVAAEPDRFVGLCNVPLQAPERAAAELRHAVTALGMVGVEIATTVAGSELDDRALDPFWATAEELRCLVLVHPLDPLTGRDVRRFFLGNLVGNPAETTIAAAHLVFGGVLERHPELRVCLVHGGGFIPYQRGRLDQGYRAKAAVTATELTRPPTSWLRRLYYDTVTHDPDVIAFLVAFAGAHHVLLGSDYPFEMGDAEPLSTLRRVPGLDDRARDAIASGNVQRLLDGVRR